MSELDGVRILISREQQPAEAWSEVIAQHGAVPVVVPLIRIRRVAGDAWSQAKKKIEELAASGQPAAVGFASARAAEHWRALLEEVSKKPEISKYVAVGTASAEYAKTLGFDATVASKPNALGMAESLVADSPPTAPVVLPRASAGRTEAIDLLKQRGRAVIDVPLYETVPVHTPESSETQPVDWVISASPSAASAFMWHRGTLMRMELVSVFTRHAVIGRTTAEAIERLGITAHAVSPEPTIESVLRTIALVPKPTDTENGTRP